MCCQLVLGSVGVVLSVQFSSASVFHESRHCVCGIGSISEQSLAGVTQELVCRISSWQPHAWSGSIVFLVRPLWGLDCAEDGEGSPRFCVRALTEGGGDPPNPILAESCQFPFYCHQLPVTTAILAAPFSLYLSTLL